MSRVRVQAFTGAKRIRRDDQQFVDTGKAFGERVGLVEIRRTDFNALGFEVGKLGGIAAAGDDVGRGHVFGFKQVMDDQLAQMAVCAGDENLAYENSLSLSSREATISFVGALKKRAGLT